ncbi:phosphoglycerol transferase MdoB-like AlkP superfamily enzyme [Paenibacillus rhizosphaerae]|uniref:Phosphoglycerol transferase MdoB-like AlkP superfamily enzyme n=1 Tax=Paenibacillus rhizosphaerae TaxID=297318 RepID=A0A839TQ45_9BACL|nr:LTA synthase family protein [Paenibacillus rhizosphaerae]MBB3128946.1 phosphoglycerol transferase MdoB-like AlkP superfamily enzyme [Paenibacillus rhizosphaerae]
MHNRFSWRALIGKPFIFFSIVMILKMLLVWTVVFRENAGSFGMMLLTGIPPVWLLFCLIETLAYRKKLVTYLIVDLVLTIIYFAVIMYYKYFGVIVTYHELRQVNQVSEVNSSVFSLMDPYYLFIFTDIVVLFVLICSNRRFRAFGRSLSVRTGRPWFAGGAVLALIACAACIFPFRSGMNEFQQARDMGILNYEAYVGFAPSKNIKVDAKSVTPEAVAQVKGTTEPAQPAYWGAAKGKNVIIIQLEAFQNFLVNLKIDGKEVTPNMNKLVKDHLYFPHFFQQVGQGNTADAEFVVNTSLYVPSNGAASEVYADKALPSAPKTFAASGYQTATFHTNSVVFWNRDQLYKALGWEKYYDDKFFGKSDLVSFGASDELLYAKTAEELARMQGAGKPFYVQVISMSGHHPFRIPESKFKMQLPDRYKGTLVGDYIQSQNYADYALGQFVDELKKNGVWDNSVIVLYGDHQGLPIYSLNNKEKKLMKEIYGREYTLPDMMNIPLVLSVPNQKAQTLEQVGGQSDIFPTLANLAGISLKNQVHFGQDLLNQNSPVLPQRYYLPSGSFISAKGAFVPGSGYADGITYPLNGGKVTKPLDSKETYERAHKLISMSDAYVSSLPEWKDQEKEHANTDTATPPAGSSKTNGSPKEGTSGKANSDSTPAAGSGSAGAGSATGGTKPVDADAKTDGTKPADTKATGTPAETKAGSAPAGSKPDSTAPADATGTPSKPDDAAGK